MFPAQGKAMPPPDALDDPDYAAFAWARYRRLLKWMALVSALAAAGVIAILWRQIGPLPIHMMIATALGVGLSVMMAAALFGLIFLSSGTGHDEAVERSDLGQDAAIWREDRR